MNWYKDRNQKIYQAWLDGKPREEIAARWGLSVWQIYKILASMTKQEIKEARKND